MLLLLLPLIAVLTAAVWICAKSAKDNSSLRNNSALEAASVAPNDGTPEHPPLQSPVLLPSQQPPPPPPDAQSSATASATQKDEKKEDIVIGPIDNGIPAVAYLLNTEEKINDEWTRSLMAVFDRVAQYQWGMKKRLAADDNSWKEIGRKIQKFTNEGFGNRNVQEDPRFVMSKDDNKKKGYKKSSFRKNTPEDDRS